MLPKPLDTTLVGDDSCHKCSCSNGGVRYKTNPHTESYYNAITQNSQLDYLKQSNVRKALHVGNTPYGSNASKTEMNLVPDFMVSMAPRMTRLLNDGLPVLIYVGQLDVIIGTPLVTAWVNKLEWEGAEEYATNERGVWKSLIPDTSEDPQQGEIPVRGYFREARNLLVVTVRDAGTFLFFVFLLFEFFSSLQHTLLSLSFTCTHPLFNQCPTHIRALSTLHFPYLFHLRLVIGHILPGDQPLAALDMITRFVEGNPRKQNSSPFSCDGACIPSLCVTVSFFLSHAIHCLVLLPGISFDSHANSEKETVELA